MHYSNSLVSDFCKKSSSNFRTKEFRRGMQQIALYAQHLNLDQALPWQDHEQVGRDQGIGPSCNWRVNSRETIPLVTIQQAFGFAGGGSQSSLGGRTASNPVQDPEDLVEAVERARAYLRGKATHQTEQEGEEETNALRRP